jgi:CubicO group peptidase (beta-lactamase class C family)
LGWDDPVRKYLPGFTLYDPYVSNEMRIRDLLCHRSGLETFSGDLVWYNTRYSRAEVLNRARYLKPAYGFRYHYGYSNIMYLAAGEIIPVVSGRTWDDFIRNFLLEPLDMNRTSVTLGEIMDDPNLAMPHHVDILDSTTRVMPYMSWENMAPAAAINSTARDMGQWIKFQLNMGEWKGEQLVSRESMWELRQLHTVQDIDMGEANTWPSRHSITGGGKSSAIQAEQKACSPRLSLCRRRISALLS